MNTHQWLDELQEYLFPAKIERLSKISRRRGRFGWSESLEHRTLLAAPVSVNDNYNATSGQTLFVPASGVLANDSDADGDPLSAQLVTPPMIGTLTFNTNGSFSYAAPTGFMGNASFAYRAYDGSSYSSQSTVTLSVSMGGGGGNQAPVARADALFVERNSSSTRLRVLWNDTDPEATALSITQVGMPAHGSASVQTDPADFTKVIAFTPTIGYTGSDSFSYTISDGSSTASTTLSLDIHAVDNTIGTARALALQNGVRLTTGGFIGDGTPSAGDVDLFSVTMTAGQILKVDVDAAAIDGGGSYGQLNSLLRMFSSSGTQVAINDNGTDPDTNASGNDSYLTYTAATSGTYYIGVSAVGNANYSPTTGSGGSNGTTGSYQLKVLRETPNFAPSALNDNASTNRDAEVLVPVLANDSDANGDVITISQVGVPLRGTAAIRTVSGVSQIAYLPNAGYSGTDSFTYTISDPSGATGTATVFVNVIANAPPSIQLQNPVTVLTESADTSSGIIVATIQITDDGLGTNSLSLSGPGAAAFVISNNKLRIRSGYVLDHETQPQLSVTVTVTDASLGAAGVSSASLTISVTDVNEPPNISLLNQVTFLYDDIGTALRTFIGDIVVVDDSGNAATIGLTGADAAAFEILNNKLYLKAGQVLNAAAKPSFSATLTIDDPSLGSGPDGFVNFELAIRDANLTEGLPVFFVNSSADSLSFNLNDDVVTFREALERSRLAGPGRSVIRFSEIIGSTVWLSAASPFPVAGDVRIEGSQDRRIRFQFDPLNNSNIRMFNITSGAKVTMQDVDLVGRRTLRAGGGIHNAGRLTLNRSSVSEGSSVNGGGVFNSNAAELRVHYSTIFNNQAISSGGGIFAEVGSSVSILNSTISGNSAQTGGGAWNAGAFQTLSLTLANNTGFTGAGLATTSGAPIVLSNSLVAGNIGSSDLNGQFISLGHNLVGNAGSVTSTFVSSDRVGSPGNIIDPRLSPLADFGGATWTHALLSGSPAIDAGGNVGIQTIDQRGAQRVLDGAELADPLNSQSTIDIGAFEFGTFFVNTTIDAPDVTPAGDGLADTDYGTEGSQVSLRAAVQELNRLAGWNGSFDTQNVLMEGVIRFRPGMGQHWMTHMGAGEDQAGFGDLDIYGNVAILGNGPQTHVDGGWGPTTPTGMDFRDRIFHVHPGSRLRLERMSIRGGHVIPDSTVVSDRGGAIYNDGGTLEIADSLFGESPLTRGGSQAKQGGFLYTRNGNVQIFNTAINAHRGEWGGAIYQESGNVLLNNSVLFANGSAFSGGGIYVVSGSLTVTDGSQLSLNFSGGVGHGQGSPSNTGIADGGAIFVAPAGLVTINGESALTGNLRISGQAQGGLALYNQGKVLIDHGHVDANGVWETLVPAIYNESELTIIDSTIDRNNSGAIVNAGGKLVLERTSLSDNQANYWGIGITNDNGSVTIRDSRFVNNFTPMFAPTILNRDLDANLSVTGSRFEGNTSEHAGGAVWNENGTVRIQTSTFLENKHWNDGAPGSGGAIHHTSRHVLLGSTPQRFLKLAAAVNNSQSVILLEDVSAIQNLPLPLGIMIGSERMQVAEVNEYFGSIRVVRNAATAESHRVSERVTTYISEQQEHLTLGDPGALQRYQLPLDVVVGLEVMTVTALQGNLATVIRGRRGTRALPHDDPSEVWGVSGSLEVSTSTFSSNRMQVMGFNDFDAGGAVSSIIRPFVTPTTIESSTFIGNEAIVGTAIMTDMEEIRLLEPDEPEPPAYERLQYWIVRKNESWLEETYQLPTTSMVVQNSVFSENQTPVPFELRLPPVAGGHVSQHTGVHQGPYTILPADSLVSGGGNFVDADAYRYTLLNSELNATATSFVVAQPSKEFPAAPFVMRISQPLDTHYVYEDILVTAWTLNAEAMQVALTVQRGHNATTPRVFPAATKVRMSDSGFWAPGDRIGTLDTEEGTIRTSLVATPSGISATATQLEVADTSKFPRVPFEIHVSHDVENPLPTGRDVYYEKMIVTAYAGNTITVERGADWTEAIAHPHGARIEIDTTLYDRLDPGLIGLFGDEAEPRLPMPMQAGSLVDSGRTDRFGNASAEIATNLAGTWGTKTPVYMAVNQNAVVTLSSTLYGDEISATLDNVASLPTVPFLLRLNDEVMTVTQVDAPTRRLTLQRAVARTERDQHDAGTVGVVGVSVTTTSDRLNVKDASIFPPAPFILQVGNERLRVNAVDTSLDILTVVRGQSGSSPVAHSLGTIATHGSLVQVIGAAALPAAPFPAWMGSEFVRVRNVDVTHGIITLERGADRDQPELHTGPNSLVFSTNGLYAGFNGSRTVADQQLSNRVVDSDGDTQYEIDRGATEAIIFRVNTEQDLAEQSPGNGRIDTASGLVSLRAAIAESNANIGESLILLPAGTFVIPEMPVNHRITIRGLGHASTILRSSTGRVFRVESTGHLELRNLAVNAGNVGGSGGAILVAGGQLTTHYTVISGSTAARGGGIANDGGRIVLWNSTLHGNTAEFNGGAIWNSGGGFAELNNVTISGNSAQSGGGVSSTLDSQLTLRNATVTLNQAIESAGGILSLGKIQLGNSIIANNSASSDRDVSGFAASLGGNLIGVIPTSAEVIASPIDLYSSTLIVGETQLLPPTPFEVRVGGVETMTVVAVNGSQWTVERSSDSANRSTHPAGTPVRLDGIWKAQDQIGVSSNPLIPGLGSLTFDAGLVPVHRLLNGSPALNAGLESVFSGVPLESTRRVKFMDRRISVSQTDSLPMVPFQIRANGETMTVVGIDNNVLETVRPQPFPHPIGTMFTVLADARGGLRSYTSIDRGAYEHLPILTISSTQSQVLETNAGTTVNFEFTIVRDGDTSQATDVEYIVLGSSNTSAEPDDFSGLKFRRQMVTFLPGETIKTISLPILGDNIVETHEEFAVELWNETAGTIVTQRRVQATILDNDSSVVTVTHTPSAEGTPATFNVVLSNPVEDGIQISWTTADGTAIAGQDYLGAQGSTSTNGLAPARFVVRTVSDLIAERNETFQVSLIGAAPAAVASRVSFATTSITGTIQNDDFVTVRAVNLTRREGNSGQTAFTFDVVTGSTPLDVPFSITVTPTGSTATAGLDFVATPVVRPFLGVARETVSFTVNGIGDQSPEPDEQFLLNLSASASGRENAFQFFNGIATILNDDSPRVFVSDVARIENNTGQLTAVFDVTLTNPMGQPVSVTVATQNGTAIAGQDFVSMSQTLAFTGMGTQTLSFSVPIIGDSALERDETFNVVLSNLQAGMMGASYYSLRNGTGTILNDDAASLSFVLPAGASWVDSGDPRTSAVLLAPRGDLQLSLQLNGQIDSSFQTTVTFMSEDDAQTDFQGLLRTKSFNGTNGELQRFPLRMSGWDFPEQVIAKVSVTGLDGRVVTLPNDLVVRIANQRNAQEMRQLGLAEETDECESTDDQVDVSDWRNEGTPGNVPIPVLIRMETYQGPDGLAYGRYVDPDGNVIPGPGIHNGIYYNTFTPDLSNAVEGDVGFGRDTWGFAIVPIEANGIWYLIGSVDRSNYGTVAMRTGKGDDTNGPMKHQCDEEEEDEEDDDDHSKPPAMQTVQTDWTVAYNKQITITPFTTFNHRLSEATLLVINDGQGRYVGPGGTLKARYGTFRVNDDKTLTYTPDANVVSRSDVPLLPELDADGNIIRFAGIDELSAHLVDATQFQANPTDVMALSSTEGTIAVSNELPVLQGARRHDKNSGFYLDAPVFADYLSSYTVDLRQIYSDLEGEAALSSLKIVDIKYNGESAAKNSTDPLKGNKFQIKTPIGRLVQYDSITGLVPVSFTEKFLTVTLANSHSLEVYNDVSSTNAQQSNWDINGYPVSLELKVRVTDGSTYVNANGETKSYEWDTIIFVRPNVYKSASQWRTQAGIPGTDYRTWVQKLEPALPNRDPDAQLKVTDWSVTALARDGQSETSRVDIGGVDVDLRNGTVRRDHALILDVSGGNSELAVQGLTYDSATVHKASRPIIQGRVQREPGQLPPTSFVVDLKWYSKMQTDNGSIVPVTRMKTETIPVMANEDQTDFIFALEVPDWPRFSGVYGWELEIDIVTAGGTVTRYVRGETPIVVGDGTPIFGAGWNLTGVPVLYVDDRDDQTFAGSKVDDRVVFAVAGETPRIFDASPLTDSNYAFSGKLKSLKAGSLALGTSGYADTNEYGTLTSKGDTNELVYQTVDGTDYWFKRQVFNGQNLYLISRIEQPGLDFNPDAANGRRGVSFNWTIPTGTTGHPTLATMVSSDESVSTFTYTEGYLSSIEVRPGGANQATVRRYDFVVDGNHDLTSITEVGVESVKREFVYSDHRMSVDKLISGTGPVERITQLQYEDLLTNRITGVVLGDATLDGASSNGAVRPEFKIKSSAGVGLKDPSAPVGTKTPTRKDLIAEVSQVRSFQAYDAAAPGSTTEVAQYEFDFRGLVVRKEVYFQAGEDSTTRVSQSKHEFVYDHLGNLKIDSGPGGRESYYWYDYEKAPTYSGTDPLNQNDLAPAYDPDDYRGNVTRIVSPTGVYHFEYETDDEKLLAVGKLVRAVHDRTIDGSGKKQIVDTSRAETLYFYDGDHYGEIDADASIPTQRLGNLSRVRKIRGERDGFSKVGADPATIAADPKDHVENWGYVNGMLSQFISASGLKTTYEYDSLRRLHITTQLDSGEFASQQKSQVTYGSHGFVSMVTNSMDGVVLSTISTLYSPFGMLLTYSMADKGGVILRQNSFEYTADGMTRAVVDGRGVRSENRYSSAGLLLAAKTAVGSIYRNQFLGGNASVEAISTYSYNSDGTLREVVSPDGSVTTWYRDLPGHIEWVAKTGVAGISTVDPSGSISTQFETSIEKSEFDSLGRIVKRNNLLTGAQTEFKYGDMRFDVPTSTTRTFLAAVGDAQEISVTTVQRFDALGNVLLEWVEGKRNGPEEEPLISVPYEYKYDELGYLKSSTRRNREGLISKFVTNPVGQVTKITKTDPRATDEKARITTVSQTYDQFGRLRVITDAYISADNDHAERIRSEISGIPIPTGPVVAAETIDFVVDSASGRIEEVRRSRSKTVTRLITDAAGQVVREHSELGLITDHTYDPNGNVIRSQTTVGQGQSAPSRTVTSEYDQQNRLRKRMNLDTTPTDGVDATRTDFTDYRTSGDAPHALDVIQTTVFPGANGGVSAVSGMNLDSLGNLIFQILPSGQVAHLIDQDGVPRSGDETYTAGTYSAPLTIRSYKYGTQDATLNDRINEIRLIQTGALPLDLTQQLVANPSFEGARITRTEYGTTGLPLVEDSERSIHTMGSRKVSQYDRLGRLSLSAYATEGTSGLTDQKTFSYDDSDEGTSTGKLAEVSESNGRKTFYRYDNEGRMLSMSDKADQAGVIAKKWSYDGLGRQIAERTRINAEGQGSTWATRSWTYLGSGTLQTDADGTEIFRLLDSAGMTASEYAYTGQSSNRELFFQSVSQLNSDGSVREVREQILPANSESSYQRLPGSDTKVLLKYDELGRLLSDSTSGQMTGGSIPSSSIAYLYGTDSGSLTANISRNVGQHVSDLRMTSDVLGRVTSLHETFDTQSSTQWLGDVRGESKLVSVQYVLDGRVASIRRNADLGTPTMPHRGISVYTYAWDGRMDSLTHFRNTLQPSTGAPISRYSMSFNLAGDVVSETARAWTANASAANWATTSLDIVNSTKTFEYQGQQLSKVTLTDAVTGTTQQKTFTLDTNGNDTDYVPAGSGYDNRIEGTENGDTTQLFEFNREGRMTHHRSITDLSGERNNDGQKSGVWTNTQEIFAYTWDHRGRLLEVKRTIATGTRTYINGMVNEQTGNTNNNGPSTWVRFVYDGLNRLTLRTELVEQGAQPVAVTTTRYVYDSTGLVMELVAKGASPTSSDFQISRHYLNGPGDVGVLAVDQTRAAGLTSPLAAGGQTTTLWAFANPGGTVSTWGYVDAANAWHLSQDLYDETGLSLGRFGQLSGGSRVPLSSSEHLLQEAPFVWRGLTFDLAADVFMVGSTAVDPDTGRFLSQAAPGANPYLFAANQFSSDSTFDPVEAYNGLNSVYTTDFNRAFGQKWIGFVGENFAANAGEVAYYGAFVGVIAGSVAGSVLGGSLLTAGSGISAIWGGASLAAEAFIAGAGSSLIDQAVSLKPGEALDWNKAIVDGLFSAGETGLVSGATTGLKALGKMGHMHGGGDELLGSSLGGLLGDSAGMAYDSYQLGNSLPSVVGGGAEGFRSLAVGSVIDVFGGGGGGHGRLQGRHFCFVAGTPVSIAMEFVSLNPLIAIDRSFDDGSNAWIACGLASMIAASLLAGDRKKRSRQIPDVDEWETEGQWWVADDPELDVSQVDFEDVCDELLSGSPGMN